MSVFTAKHLAEYLSKLPPEQELFAIIYTKDEVEENNGNVPSFPITDEHWTNVVNRIDNDHLDNYAEDSFREAMRDVLKEYNCADCFGYDYRVVDNPDNAEEKICMGCRDEEEDVVY